MQFDPLSLIQQFIPSAKQCAALLTQTSDFRPGIYQSYHIDRTDAPYSQEVCLYKSASPIIDPLFDAGELSLVEGLEDATGMTTQGYFTADGLFVAANTRDGALHNATLFYNGYYYALYLLR